MKILFTCGGTAGHINPALGVAGRLKKLVPDTKVLFIGAAGMMETELVPREGYEIRTIGISNLSRSVTLAGLKHNLHTARSLVQSIRDAKRIIREFRPDVVVGTGGYVCYPVLRAAHALGIPTLVHESNAVPGLTTKLLAHSVDCVMVGFENAGDAYPAGTKVVFTGTPVREGFENIGREEALSERALMTRLFSRNPHLIGKTVRRPARSGAMTGTTSVGRTSPRVTMGALSCHRARSGELFICRMIF